MINSFYYSRLKITLKLLVVNVSPFKQFIDIRKLFILTQLIIKVLKMLSWWHHYYQLNIDSTKQKRRNPTSWHLDRRFYRPAALMPDAPAVSLLHREAYLYRKDVAGAYSLHLTYGLLHLTNQWWGNGSMAQVNHVYFGDHFFHMTTVIQFNPSFGIHNSEQPLKRNKFEEQVELH